jgi:hypothetical protein
VVAISDCKSQCRVSGSVRERNERMIKKKVVGRKKKKNTKKWRPGKCLEKTMKLIFSSYHGVAHAW